jgi:NAD(P)-dependent dehydrogenase (short-subunit alcohol dehydrogenase family)
MADQGGDLSGKVAIVTGSGGVGNIGATTARVLAQAGARVVLADLAGSRLEETTRALSDEGFEVAQCPTDISQEAQVQALMAFTKKTFGRLDVLDNNAASQGHREDGVLGDMSVELWDKVFSVNARGTMLMCKHALPLMIEGGGGSIINISSGTAQAGDFFSTAYASTKGAINTLTKYVATQYGSQGIRCNAVAPGLVMTSMLMSAMPEPILQIFRGHSLTGSLGQPQDIAEAVAFLASERSRFITGQVIPVDGGIFAHIPTVVEVAAVMAKAAG